MLEQDFLEAEELLRDNLKKNLNVFKKIAIEEFDLTTE